MTQDILHDSKPLDLVSAGSAAEILKLDRSMVTRLMQSGRLVPATHVDHGVHRVPLFFRSTVERLAAIRSGEIGDVLDRIDVHAAAADPTEDRNAYVRAAWLTAIETVTKRTGGTFHTGQLRPFLPEDARGHAPGALIAGLVRGRRIEAINNDGTLGDARARHASSPCKTYRVIGALR